MLLLLVAKPPKTPEVIKPLINDVIEALLALWPLWLMLAVIWLARLAYRLYRLRRLSRSGIAEIDTMDGRTFEVFLSTLFRSLGYGVELTRYRGDYGADLVVKRDGRKIVVQAKRWKKAVGVKAVQEAVAAKAMYDCEGALVVANRDYTEQARRLARANKVELWDRDKLVSTLLATKGKTKEHSVPGTLAPQTLSAVRQAPETTPTSIVTTTPSGDAAQCTMCGATVSEKVRDYCLTRPTRFGGRVYCFNHQRSANTLNSSASRSPGSPPPLHQTGPSTPPH